MADSDEPKRETVNLTVSPQPSSAPSVPVESGDTVRIHFPTRLRTNPTSPPEEPSPGRAAAAMAAPVTSPAPKKETARITALDDPPAKPAVQMKKTQPLIDLPRIETPSTTVTVTPAAQPVRKTATNQIPMPLCWALVGGSAAVLILQIWNYLS
jgi:hypothetical protein